jgi:hypothetical protein
MTGTDEDEHGGPGADSGPVALAAFVHSPFAARSVGEVARAFQAGFGRVVDAPIYGFDLVHSETGALPTTSRRTSATSPWPATRGT